MEIAWTRFCLRGPPSKCLKEHLELSAHGLFMKENWLDDSSSCSMLNSIRHPKDAEKRFSIEMPLRSQLLTLALLGINLRKLELILLRKLWKSMTCYRNFACSAAGPHSFDPKKRKEGCSLIEISGRIISKACMLALLVKPLSNLSKVDTFNGQQHCQRSKH